MNVLLSEIVISMFMLRNYLKNRDQQKVCEKKFTREIFTVQPNDGMVQSFVLS